MQARIGADRRVEDCDTGIIGAGNGLRQEIERFTGNENIDDDKMAL